MYRSHNIKDTYKLRSLGVSDGLSVADRNCLSLSFNFKAQESYTNVRFMRKIVRNNANIINCDIQWDKVPDLEKGFEGRVDARIGNERQSIVRQELCVLAQDCATSLQVLLEWVPPLVQFSLVLDRHLPANRFIRVIKKLSAKLVMEKLSLLFKSKCSSYLTHHPCVRVTMTMTLCQYWRGLLTKRKSTTTQWIKPLAPLSGDSRK